MPATSADFLAACVFYHVALPLSTEIAGILRPVCGFFAFSPVNCPAGTGGAEPRPYRE